MSLSSSKVLSKFKLKKTVHQFFPIDSNYLTKKFLDYWKPSIAIFIESEIWPNMLLNAKKQSVPLVLLNARITKKSYNKWKIIPSMSKILFKNFDICLSQNNETKKYLESLGAKKIKLLGNLKFSESKNDKNYVFDNKLKMGDSFGLTHKVLGGDDRVNDKIREVVGSGGADVVIDTTGNSRVIEQAYDLTHPDGKTILVGVPNKGDNVSIYTLPLHFNKVLTGSHGGDSVPDIEIPRYIRLIKSEKMTLDGLITHEFSLDEINDALDLFRSGEAGRIIIDML